METIKQTVVITKLAYLKKVKYKWAINNDVGGSFSNSGEYASRGACAIALRRGAGHALDVTTPVHIVTVEWDYERDKPIETVEKSVLAAELEIAGFYG